MLKKIFKFNKTNNFFIKINRRTSNPTTNKSLFSNLFCNSPLDKLEVKAIMNALLIIPITFKNLNM
jgi:hypothetical protein